MRRAGRACRHAGRGGHGRRALPGRTLPPPPDLHRHAPNLTLSPGGAPVRPRTVTSEARWASALTAAVSPPASCGSSAIGRRRLASARAGRCSWWSSTRAQLDSPAFLLARRIARRADVARRHARSTLCFPGCGDRTASPPTPASGRAAAPGPPHCAARHGPAVRAHRHPRPDRPTIAAPRQLLSQLTAATRAAVRHEQHRRAALPTRNRWRHRPGGGRAQAQPGPDVHRRGHLVRPGVRRQPTASGEIFDPCKLTAASPWLAFGTMVQVTSTVTHRSVTVRVNDRGPFGRGVLDLSQHAACGDRPLRLAGVPDPIVRSVRPWPAPRPWPR